MKALILNGSNDENDLLNSVSDFLFSYLGMKKYEVEVRVLRNENIGSCLGCFGCWLKTPGECVIKDAGHDLPQKVIQSDIVLLLTPITFGMYSSELKKALDRFPCPVLLPFFKKINGEFHHESRYSKYPTLVAIGSLPNPDEESENTFSTLVSRNGLNLHAATLSRIIYLKDNQEVIEGEVRSTLSKAGIN